MFSLTELRERVYLLKIDSSYELSMTFLRYEEFYESPNPRYQGRAFTLAAFMSWYSAEKGKGFFTYPEDWGGFNMPANVIWDVHRSGISDPNHYDRFMMSIYEQITTRCHDAYIIGVSKNDPDKTLLSHELTHAMYYVDVVYRNELDELIARLPVSFAEEVKQAMRDAHYAESSIIDEIGAYIATGEANIFKNVKNKRRMTILRKDIKALHKKHYSKFLP